MAAGGQLLLGSPCWSSFLDNWLLEPRADSRSQLSGKRSRRGDSRYISGTFFATHISGHKPRATKENSVFDHHFTAQISRGLLGRSLLDYRLSLCCGSTVCLTVYGMFCVRCVCGVCVACVACSTNPSFFITIDMTCSQCVCVS